MAGVRLEFKFDDKDLRDALRRKVQMLEDKTPLLKSIGEEMLPQINKRFKEERGPDGDGWTPLSSKTISARLKRYGNSPLTILRMRGHLAGSINYQVGPASLKIGTGSEVEAYAAIHQFGGDAGRNGSAPIPARPYLGFSDDDLDIIQEETEAYLSDFE